MRILYASNEKLNIRQSISNFQLVLVYSIVKSLCDCSNERSSLSASVLSVNHFKL